VTSFSRASFGQTLLAIPTIAFSEVPQARTELHEATLATQLPLKADLRSSHPLRSTHQLVRTRHRTNMDAAHRAQIIRLRAVAKSSLTRMQSFIETGDRKLNDIQVRFDELPKRFNKSETAQSELEL